MNGIMNASVIYLSTLSAGKLNIAVDRRICGASNAANVVDVVVAVVAVGDVIGVLSSRSLRRFSPQAFSSALSLSKLIDWKVVREAGDATGTAGLMLAA